MKSKADKHFDERGAKTVVERAVRSNLRLRHTDEHLLYLAMRQLQRATSALKLANNGWIPPGAGITTDCEVTGRVIEKVLHRRFRVKDDDTLRVRLEAQRKKKL